MSKPPQASTAAAAAAGVSTGGTVGNARKPATPATGPSEDQLRHSAIVASTFANMQLLTTKETLSQYSGLYAAAKEDLSKVGEEMLERDRDHMKVVDYLRAQNIEAQEKIKNQRAEFTERIDNFKRDFEREKDELRELLEEKDQQISQLTATVDQQQADLDSLNAFKRERHDIHSEISNYKQRQAEIALEHEQELSKVKFAALEERVRLKAEERKMRERFESEVLSQASVMLDVRTREIHAENAQLIEDKILQQKEIDRLARDNKALKAKNDEQRRELELSKGAEGEYSVRCAKQSIEIKELKKQIQLLEQNLSKVIESYESKLRTMTSTSSGTLDKLQAERDAAYRNAEGRQKELLKLRSVARSVVDQRSELEMFFHEALAFVRGEILAERAERNRQLQIEAQQQHLLRIKGGASTSSPSAAVSPSATSRHHQQRSHLHQFLPREAQTAPHVGNKALSLPSPPPAANSQTPSLLPQLVFSPNTPNSSATASPFSSPSSTARTPAGILRGQLLRGGRGGVTAGPAHSYGVGGPPLILEATPNRQKVTTMGEATDTAQVESGVEVTTLPSIVPRKGSNTSSTGTALPPPPTSSSTPSTALVVFGDESHQGGGPSSSTTTKGRSKKNAEAVVGGGIVGSPSTTASYMGHTANTAARADLTRGAAATDRGDDNNNSNADYVDIADLTWDDKERVLRILFAKINSKEQQQQAQTVAVTPSSIEGATPATATPMNNKERRDKRFLRDASSTTFFTQ